MSKDYYKTLGLTKSATPEEIKQSYHKLAKQFHPDKNPNDASAADKFKVIKEAYENLSDPQKKAIYDNPAMAPRANNMRARGQGRGQNAGFNQFFTTPGAGQQSGAASSGPRIFAFNVFGANVPVEDVLKMFFGGMNDFGPSQNMGRPQQGGATYPNNMAPCPYCLVLVAIPNQYNHQKNCPKRPKTEAEYRQRFPEDFATSSTQDAEYTFFSNGFIECPSCHRSFNADAASRHIPYCMKKTEETGKPSNPLKTEQSSFKRSKEYADNLKRKQKDGTANNHNIDLSKKLEIYLKSKSNNICTRINKSETVTCNGAAGSFGRNRILLNNGLFNNMSDVQSQQIRSFYNKSSFSSFCNEINRSKNIRRKEASIKIHGYQAV